MEDEEIDVIVASFGVDRKLALEALNVCGKDLVKIRNYLLSKGEKNLASCKCLCCGRVLKDPRSIKRGYGDECYRRMQHALYNDLFDS